MPLLAIRDLTLSFGGPPVLHKAQLTIEPRERVCLLGRNGEGKSSLLNVISGDLSPDSAEYERAPGLSIARLPQEVPAEMPGTVFDIAVLGAPEKAQVLSRYHHLSARLGDAPDSEMNQLMAELDDLQQEIDASGAWELDQHVERILTRLQLNGETPFDQLSGGMKRRALLAQCLVREPDLLLLDEPTNHLDIANIQWLEQFLLNYDKAVLFITHDRSFLRRLATRILELDRGQLVSFDCNYDRYLERKQELLEAEEKQNAVFDKKLAQEETWIRRGIKARRTRNEGRVRALQQMRRERSKRREQQGSASLSLQDSQLSGRKVITAKDLSVSYDGLSLIRDFSTTIWRGDKIGLIGPNGSGKTTLLRTLLGTQTPQTGEVEHGTKLRIAYFDQLRATLDPSKTVQENVWDISDHVTWNGQKRHILSYLQDFLFTPDRARSPVNALSGGERNRLLLAKLFLEAANLLVMDEPTNDLDIETIELLEDILLNFDGTLLLVSHDRDFLDSIVTSTLVFEGDGKVTEYVGGYSDWVDTVKRQRQATSVVTAKEAEPAQQKATVPANKGKAGERGRMISQKEQRELEQLPAKIEDMEQQQTALVAAIAQPDFFQKTGKSAEQAAAELRGIEQTLEKAYQRWTELEALPRKS